MKTKVNQFLIVALIALTVASCKDEKKNEAEVSAAEEVKEAPEEAVAYNVDASNSMIEWTGKKPTGEHTGTIKVTEGTVKTKYGKVESGNFTIDMTSIEVTDLEGDEKTSLEGHLKGEGEGKEDHFFNVAEHPSAKFEVTGITEKEGKTMIDGNLTLKGKTQNISFPATTSVNNDVMELSSETFTINRTDWGVNYGSKSVFENLGDKFINDDVEVKITIKANKA